jgi:hypothetical protein
MTVKQLLNNTDSRELSEWQAFFEIYNEQFRRDEDKPLAEKIKSHFGKKARRK